MTTDNQRRNQEIKSRDDCSEKIKGILAYLQACFLFPDTLNHYISKYEIVQVQLASLLHVDPSTVSHWRKGRRLPQDSAAIYQIAKAIDLSNKERQYLLVAWTVHNSLAGMIPYVSEMVNDETTTWDDMEDIQSQLSSVLSVLKHR